MDWLAIGYRAPKPPFCQLEIVPPVPGAKFGKKLSAIGAEAIEFLDIRIVHARYFSAAT
jgi:hypothetical protein